jgi:hypothetical protein
MPINHTEFEIVSDEIQQIIGQVPKWITRWGITVLFSLLMIILIVGNFVKYPTVLNAESEIIAKERPTKVDWFNEEHLLYTEVVKDGQHVKIGDSLLIENNLKTEKISVITSPIAGEISLTRGYKTNANTHIIWIIPKTTIYSVVLKVPIQKSGKVKIGQEVKINLDEYPVNEFGFLSGKVVDIMPIAMEGTYRINVKLDKKMITNLGASIPAKPNYAGNAEIISDKMSIVQRIFRGLI